MARGSGFDAAFAILLWPLVVCMQTGVMAIANVLTAALSAVDPHFTKTTLEHVERELCRHAISLAVASPPSQTGRLTVQTTAQQQVQ